MSYVPASTIQSAQPRKGTLMQKLGKLLLHVERYVSRYATLTIAILTPLAGLLGTLAAEIGNQNALGKALLAATSAIGMAIAGVTWLYNRGKWERETGERLADGKMGLFDLIAIGKSTLNEVERARKELPKFKVPVAEPAVPAKPHKPTAPPPTVPVAPPPVPQPVPTHPPAKTNPVKGILGKVGGIFGLGK
jgi:hypothetical protein